MTITTRIGARACVRRPKVHRPRTARDALRALRARPADRIVRWIGARDRRRAGREAGTQPTPSALESLGTVVALTWEQTFGRAARQMLARESDEPTTVRTLVRHTA